LKWDAFGSKIAFLTHSSTKRTGIGQHRNIQDGDGDGDGDDSCEYNQTHVR